MATEEKPENQENDLGAVWLLLCVIIAAMETDAEKQKEEPAVDDSAAATAVSKADTSQVWNDYYSLKFKVTIYRYP